MIPITFFKEVYVKALFCFLAIGLFSCAEFKKAPRIALDPKSEVKPVEDVSFVPDGFYEKIPEMPIKGYKIKSLGGGIYFFTTGIYNTLFIVTSEGVLIVDPLGGKGHLLKNAIEDVTSLPIKIMVYTHSHIDHIGDAYLFASGAQIIAHKETRRLLARYKDPNRPLPHITFDRNYILSFGGLKIELIFVAAGHDMGNIMVYLPSQRVLMLVDVATPKAVPFKNFSSVDIFGQIIGIRSALKLEWDFYIAGHLYRPGKKSEMKEILNYYYSTKKANAEALKRVSFKGVLSRTQSKDIERIFGEYYDAVGRECYQILKKRWKSRLMGFEAFARGHCDVWTAFHRTHKHPGK